MLDPEIEAALNDQINFEQSAAHEYLAMAAHFEQRNLKGFAAFMKAQSFEERDHAMRLFDHVFSRGGRVTLGSIVEPRSEFESPKAVFDAAYSREQANTRAIHDLYGLAANKNDYPTQTMLQWFITEQVEEEEWCQEAVTLLEMAGDNKSALLMLDRRYGEHAQEG